MLMTRLGSVPFSNFVLFRLRLVNAVMFPVGGRPCFFPLLEDDHDCRPSHFYRVDDVPLLCCLSVFSCTVVYTG